LAFSAGRRYCLVKDEEALTIDRVGGVAVITSAYDEAEAGRIRGARAEVLGCDEGFLRGVALLRLDPKRRLDTRRRLLALRYC
jgi:hypothetical protein